MEGRGTRKCRQCISSNSTRLDECALAEAGSTKYRGRYADKKKGISEANVLIYIDNRRLTNYNLELHQVSGRGNRFGVEIKGKRTDSWG